MVVMQKLTPDDVMVILERALERNKQAVVVDDKGNQKKFAEDDSSTRWVWIDLKTVFILIPNSFDKN